MACPAARVADEASSSQLPVNARISSRRRRCSRTDLARPRIHDGRADREAEVGVGQPRDGENRTSPGSYASGQSSSDGSTTLMAPSKPIASKAGCHVRMALDGLSKVVVRSGRGDKLSVGRACRVVCGGACRVSVLDNRRPFGSPVWKRWRCTRQFFTKSFLGDGAAVLARLSGEPASPRHRAGVASMAWRTTLRFRRTPVKF